MSGITNSLVEEVSVGLEDREQQDGEAPEREGVGQPGNGLLEELPLPAHLDQLGPDSGRDVTDPPGVGAPGAHQAAEEVEAPAGDGGGEDGDGQADDNPDGQLSPPVGGSGTEVLEVPAGGRSPLPLVLRTEA